VFDTNHRRFRFLIARADLARDAKQYDAAATLYAEALRLRPGHAGIHVQHGHMLKEQGKFDLALIAYAEAERVNPDDADLALQIGHLHKVAGRPEQAVEHYRRALVLHPGWAAAADELRQVEETIAARAARIKAYPVSLAAGQELSSRSAEDLNKLVPELAPRRYDDLLQSYAPSLDLRRVGHRETTFWGNRAVLRGVEAIRGVCISPKPIVEVEIFLDGNRIYRGGVRGGFALPLEASPHTAQKYVFNHWIDFAPFPRGLHGLAVRCLDIDGGALETSEEIVVADPALEADYPNSDFVIEPDPTDVRSLETQIRTRPSMVRGAKRASFPDGVRNVLVMRTDQLGDMVASIPAIQRLRDLLPAAHIVGLLNFANGELARSLDLFDEVIVIDFPDDPVERRRLMTLDAQEQLHERLAPYEFDIAIDLAQAGVSRNLLRLAGAKFTYGTGGEDWPWLSSDYQFHTRDRWNRHDFTPHSTKVLGLVETLGTLLKSPPLIIRRPDISRATVAGYGITPDDRFAVLHTGARIGFSRWPHYGELCARLLKATDLKIVIITEDPLFSATLSDDIINDPRVLFLDRRLPFDHFDAFLSFATVMVGNDSGPKHLASLRGTNVVTIFSARINWQEWGQENVGVIVSRKIPCAGCALLHDAEECGRDFICVTDIKVEEVFDAAMVYIVQAAETKH
jgi:ADP-heptose:LPS heptosyltransferase